VNENKRSYRTNLSLNELTLNLDAEVRWPPLSARYDVSLEDICGFIWEERECVHHSQVYQFIDPYICTFVLTNSLLGDELTDVLMSLGRARLFNACHAAFRKPIADMLGVDHHFLDQWQMLLLQGWTETEQLAHQHLASLMYHWAWAERDTMKAETALQALADILRPYEGKKDQNPTAFPCSGFAHAVVRGFQRFQRPPTEKVVIHGTGIPTVRPPALAYQARG
jgi:hypothetical protein